MRLAHLAAAALVAALAAAPAQAAYRLKPAGRRAIDATLDCFVTSAVQRHDLAASYDLVTPAMEGEALFHGSCITADTAPTIRALADLAPRTLALMHGPAFAGDCTAALHGLADGYADLFSASVDAVVVR